MSFLCRIRQQFSMAAPLLLLTVTLGVTGEAYGNDAKTEKQLRELKQTIEALKKELASTKNSRNDINQALEKTEKSIGDLSKKAKKIEGKLKEREQKLDNLRDERSQLNQQKRDQQGLVAEYINAAYRIGQQSNLRLLLNQEDPARVSRNLKYYDRFVSTRAQKISSYVATIDRINAIEPEIAYQASQIKADFAELQSQRSKLVDKQAERKITLAKLSASIASQDKQLSSLQEDRRQLERLLTKVIENIADVQQNGRPNSFASLKGKLPWPTKGKVLKRFGSSRVANKMRWEGVLIGSKEGASVQAVHYGRIVFSDYLRGHGLLIIVDHGSGFLSLYAHNQALYRELGEWVESGDIIAAVGNSGGQRNSALYFELRHNGKPTNPQRWFRRV